MEFNVRLRFPSKHNILPVSEGTKYFAFRQIFFDKYFNCVILCLKAQICEREGFARPLELFSKCIFIQKKLLGFYLLV